MTKKNSYRWLICIFLAVMLIGVALWNILPPYIDRWQSTKDYKNLPKNMSVMNPNQMTGSRRKKTGGAPTLKSNLTS